MMGGGTTLPTLVLQSILIIFHFLMFPQVQALNCLQCTDETSSLCIDGGSSASSQLSKACPGSSPIGCQIVAVQYNYPISTYFYRDCMYQNYLACHPNLNANGLVGTSSEEKKFVEKFDLKKYIACINAARSSLGLPTLRSDDFPSQLGSMSRYLYFAEKDTEAMVSLNDGDPTILNPNKAPDDPKEITGVSCHVCDSRTDGECDGYATNLRIKSKRCPDPVQGCYLLYEEDATGKIKWFERNCWHPGMLHCLNGRKRNLGRKFADDKWILIPEPCSKARSWLNQNKLVVWMGEVKFQSSQEYDDSITCHNDIVDQVSRGGQPAAPPSQRYKRQANPERTLYYYFCSPTDNCNDIPSRNYNPKSATITARQAAARQATGAPKMTTTTAKTTLRTGEPVTTPSPSNGSGSETLQYDCRCFGCEASGVSSIHPRNWCPWGGWLWVGIVVFWIEQRLLSS